MTFHEWRDITGDDGHVKIPAMSSGFVQIGLRQDPGFRDDWIECVHHLTPDTARAVADALYQAAFEIDGKGATVAELTAQLEQARWEIEYYKKVIDAPKCKPCTCGNDGLASETVIDVKSTIRCPKCGRIVDAPTMKEATERWNEGRNG